MNRELFQEFRKYINDLINAKRGHQEIQKCIAICNQNSANTSELKHLWLEHLGSELQILVSHVIFGHYWSTASFPTVQYIVTDL